MLQRYLQYLTLQNYIEQIQCLKMIYEIYVEHEDEENWGEEVVIRVVRGARTFKK